MQVGKPAGALEASTARDWGQDLKEWGVMPGGIEEGHKWSSVDTQTLAWDTVTVVFALQSCLEEGQNWSSVFILTLVQDTVSVVFALQSCLCLLLCVVCKGLHWQVSDKDEPGVILMFPLLASQLCVAMQGVL